MDLQLAGMINASRALPGTESGARAWGTHITCAQESPYAPEIATSPTRRLVSHAGYDATLRLRVPDALKQLASVARGSADAGAGTGAGAGPGAGTAPFLMWVVVGLNTTSFHVIGGDLYPLPKTTDHLAVRSFYGDPCVNNSDPFMHRGSSRGCLALTKDARKGDLFDIASNAAPCPAAGLCKNKLTLHSIYSIPASATHPVLLGDFGTYASLSGYRFRLATPKAADIDGGVAAVRDVIVVGAPGEVVLFSYLIPHSGSASGWLLKEIPVTVGRDGKQQFSMV